MIRSMGILTALSLLVVMGCVVRTEHTINAHITLDIRHIEEQAAGVLDFIGGESDTLPGLEEPVSNASWLHGVWDVINPMPVAHAAELKASSPLIKEIALRLRDRYGDIQSLSANGCLGENNRGYVELRDCDEASNADRKNEIQKVMSEENKDRKALYNEVARLNKDQGVSVSAVERIYAEQRLARGKTGESFQLPAAGEFFDALKESPVGKKLGSKLQPAAWIKLP